LCFGRHAVFIFFRTQDDDITVIIYIVLTNDVVDLFQRKRRQQFFRQLVTIFIAEGNITLQEMRQITLYITIRLLLVAFDIRGFVIFLKRSDRPGKLGFGHTKSLYTFHLTCQSFKAALYLTWLGNK